MTRIDLGRVVDLETGLEADAGVDADTLRRRDRAFGRDLALRADDATARVAAWLDRQRVAQRASPGDRARGAQRTLRTLLALAGIAAGTVTALAVFSYDGERPVNVVQVLAVFVALQLATLVATLLLALPESWRRRVPGLAALQDVLRLASPGRWLPALRRLLGGEQRDALDRALGLARRHQRLYGDAQKWSLLFASQLFAVGFHAAALTVALARVGFSDLAFGWSTTLDVDVEGLHRVASTLSWPFAQWLPEAVPSRELIEQTRYFRGAGGLSVDALRSAEWWRFVLFCMACYGLLPRLVALVWVTWRERVAWTRVFATLPGVTELRDRLDSRWVSTAASDAEPDASNPASGERTPPLHRLGRVRAVRWSGIPIPEREIAALVAELLGAEVAGVLDGGAGTDRSDEALVAELARGSEAPLLLVKAWEPPLLELCDLVSDLRAACGNERPILVLPLDGDASGGFAPPPGDDARTWARRLDVLGDPRVEVVTGASAR